MAEEKVQNKEKGHKSLVALLIVLIFIIIGLVVGILLVLNWTRGGEVGDEEDGEASDTEVINYVAEIERVTGEIGTKIEEAETPAEKARLHLERGYELYNLLPEAGLNKWDEVCDDAYAAEELAPSAESARLISGCEEMRENLELSNQYLEISEERGRNEGQAGGG